MENLLFNRDYQYLIGFVFALLGFGSFWFSFMPNDKPQLKAYKASIQSWWIIAPVMFVLFSFEYPWPLIFLTLISIYSTKRFFQMVGMYHRRWFVMINYLFLILLSFSVYYENKNLYNLIPIIYFGILAFIPVLKGQYKNMVQYFSLSIFAFLSFGWSFLHLALIYSFEKGLYLTVLVYILCEVSEQSAFLMNYYIGRTRLFSSLKNMFYLEGLLGSFVLCLLLSYGFGHFLFPEWAWAYHFILAFIASFVGLFGDLFMKVVRKDLKVKEHDIFIIGRGDVLERMDKMIFVSPVLYYLYPYLEMVNL